MSLRGNIDGARVQLGEIADVLTGTSSSQDEAGYLCMQAVIAFGAGDLAEARSFGLGARGRFTGGDSLYAAVIAGHAAVLLGDLSSLRGDREFFEYNAIFGDWFARSHASLEAGVLALEGNSEESIAAYRRVIDEWRAADLRFDLALALLERALLLGAHDPEAAGGRDEAAAIFEEMGATGLLERLERGAAAGKADGKADAARTTSAREGATVTSR
jgi:hypothetical protein